MRFKKTVMTGALALSVIVGASAAYASPNSSAGNESWKLSGDYGQSVADLLNSLSQECDSIIVWPGMSFNMPGANSGDNASSPIIHYYYGYPDQYGNGYGQGEQSNPNTGASSDPGMTDGTDGSEGNSGANNGANTDMNANPSAGADTGAGANPGANTDTGANVNAGDDSGSMASAYAAQVVALVNKERANAGLSPLAEDSALSNMALDKAKDMYTNNYFDHTSPTYGSPFDMMKAYGISYSYAGENIAKGQRDPEEVMNAWMNSTGHRENILSPNYTKIGVAYYNGEWVQEFIAN